MRGFVRRVKKESGFRYYPIIVVDERQRSLGGFSRKKDAEAKLKKAVEEYASGISDDINFAIFCEKFLADKKLSVKQSTLADYSGVISKHLKWFNRYRLREITPQLIDEYKGLKLKEVSPRTVNKTLMVLGMIFKRAVIWGYLRDNPCHLVERLREPHKEMAFLTPAQVVKFLDNCTEKGYPSLSVAVLTGLREGELFALEWSDFDSEKGTLSVTKSRHQKYGVHEPKTRAGKRTVKLAPSTVELLESIRGEGRMFPVGSMSWFVKSEFYPTLERAELPKIRFHDLRHTYATMMIALGENMKFIQVQLGHSSIKTTMDTYGHLLPQVSEGFDERLQDLIFERKVIIFPRAGEHTVN